VSSPLFSHRFSTSLTQYLFSLSTSLDIQNINSAKFTTLSRPSNLSLLVCPQLSSFVLISLNSQLPPLRLLMLSFNTYTNTILRFSMLLLARYLVITIPCSAHIPFTHPRVPFFRLFANLFFAAIPPLPSHAISFDLRLLSFFDFNHRNTVRTFVLVAYIPLNDHPNHTPQSITRILYL
jgi:hypothetical protein